MHASGCVKQAERAREKRGKLCRLSRSLYDGTQATHMPFFLPRWQKPFWLLGVSLILEPLTWSQPSVQVPFQPPAGVLVAGLRETATHRSSTPTLRITSDPGMPSHAMLWLHLDAAGRVLEVKNIETESFFSPHYDPKELVEGISMVTYIPFSRHGHPVEAWAQEKVELLVREDAAPLHKAVTPFPDMSSPADFSSGCPVPAAVVSVQLIRSRFPATAQSAIRAADMPRLGGTHRTCQPGDCAPTPRRVPQSELFRRPERISCPRHR